MSTDALVVVKDDHKVIKQLFRAFEKADDAKGRGEIATQIIAKLTAHTEMEDTILYPALREKLPQIEDDILESYEEHHAADLLLEEVKGLDADAENFEAKVTVLIEVVEHHIEEEEENWFPKVRDALDRDELLQDLGQQMLDYLEAGSGATVDLTEGVSAPR